MTGIQIIPPDKSYESELAQQLMAQGNTPGAVYSPMQGIGKISQSLIGAYLQKQSMDNQQQRQQALTDNLHKMIDASTKSDGTIDNIALGKALMGQPETASMGLQMLTTAADNQAKVKAMPTGMRTLDPTDPKDAAMLKGLPAGSYQIDTNKGTENYGKISPVGSQNPANQPDADPSKPLSPGREMIAQGLANYTIDPKAPMFRYAGPNEYSRAMYINSTFDMNKYPERHAAYQSFAPNGNNGKTLSAINTATQHLGLLRDYATALNNGDVPTANALANQFQKAFGDPKLTNFNSIASTVAAEVTNANTKSGGTLGDRDEILKNLNPSGSPKQMLDGIDSLQKLMSGKLNAVQLQFVDPDTGLGKTKEEFQKLLLPATQQFFNSPPPATQQQAPQGALDALKANNTPQMQAFFKQKYGYLPP